MKCGVPLEKVFVHTVTLHVSDSNQRDALLTGVEEPNPKHFNFAPPSRGNMSLLKCTPFKMVNYME